MRSSDWSSDVCSSDLVEHATRLRHRVAHRAVHLRDAAQRIAVLRLVLLAAAERLETLVELLAAVALRERHPLPADVEVQRARVVEIGRATCREKVGQSW